MSLNPSHQTSIVMTPSTLKQQITIRMHTLLNKNGGSYYTYNDDGGHIPMVTIEDVDVYGLEVKGKDVYLMTVVNTDESNDGSFSPYNSNEFYIEQLWDVYLAMESIYELRMVDYGSLQD